MGKCIKGVPNKAHPTMTYFQCRTPSGRIDFSGKVLKSAIFFGKKTFFFIRLTCNLIDCQTNYNQWTEFIVIGVIDE